MSTQNAALDAQQAALDSRLATVDAARADTGKLETTISLEDSGADASRVAADTKVIGSLLKRALTWDSDASYREARDSTMRTYSLAEDSAFMTSFLPKAPVNLDSRGNEYPYIDAAGLNSQVSDFKVKLLSVNAVNYDYMVLADVQAKSSDGLGTSVNVATVFVTLNGDGAPTAITGFASTTQPRTSG
ncbi:hypothetical protein [Cryobacterium zhongshanensis]|uniref:Uncharacterized protein n=1 Tax=Cryobacterium zhongshanensis TaxID=2928153 RepID=A0AA41UGV3_9MICO|nr:hypothetical protein [Cryobacterium zhongshanensis]MCI4659587.1 hypothetical protein [Cryobacterium zhongshanensis]